MVSESPTGGGAAEILYDRNLQDAYDAMRWYRHVVNALLRRYQDYDGSNDPVMPILNPVDWDKSVPESSIDILAKGVRDVESIADELDSLKSKINQAWHDDLIVSKVEAVIGTLAKDYEKFHETLKKMRKHGEHDLPDGMNDATGHVREMAEDLKTRYGGMEDFPLDPTNDEGLANAKRCLELSVERAEGEIGKLRSFVKSDKDPIHISSAPPPEGYQ